MLWKLHFNLKNMAIRVVHQFCYVGEPTHYGIQTPHSTCHLKWKPGLCTALRCWIKIDLVRIDLISHSLRAADTADLWPKFYHNEKLGKLVLTRDIKRREIRWRQRRENTACRQGVVAGFTLSSASYTYCFHYLGRGEKVQLLLPKHLLCKHFGTDTQPQKYCAHMVARHDCI